MPEERARAQLEATRGLTKEAAALREAIEHSPVVRDLRRMVIALAIVCVALLGGGIWLAIVAGTASDAATSSENATNRVEDAIVEIEHEQVINCQNNNEVRIGQREWADFLLTASDDGGAVESLIIQKILNWTNLLFAERDCSDLDKKYPIPPRPDLTKLLEEARK